MNNGNTEEMDSSAQDSIQSLIQQISYPLYNCKGWMKFLGVLSIIGGLIYAITIFGLIIAWLPIWIGVILFQSATAIEKAYETASEYELQNSLSKLKTYFIITGVLALVSIILSIIMFFFGFMGVLFSQSEIRY